METKLHKSTRGIWIFIDGKHKKTVPKKYENIVQKYLAKLDFKRKYLSDNETKILELHYFKENLKEYLKTLKTKEKHLHQLIAKSKPVGVRFVYSKNGNRFELVFDNNIKIKCSKKLFNLHPIKLEDAHLNY
jgi:hypothetical protein